MAGAHAEAAAAYGRALALTVDPRLRAWLDARRSAAGLASHE
jgi:predicted RNA polymerase sigma factor